MKREESTEVAKENRDGVQRAMDLISHEWKELDAFLGDSVGKENPMKIEFASKVVELRARQKALALKEKEAEAREVERQKFVDEKQRELDERALKLESEERVLAKDENEMHSRFQEIRKTQSELRVGKKKVADLSQILDAEVMMFELAMIKSDSAAKGKGAGQKKQPRNVVKTGESSRRAQSSGDPLEKRSVIGAPPGMDQGQNAAAEIGESSTRPQLQSSGVIRNVQEAVNQDQHELAFTVTMSPYHKIRDYTILPASFISAYDMSRKEHVILITDEGRFRLHVKQYSGIQRTLLFKYGWKRFYQKNHLSVGMKCLFKLKEHAVDGDDSVFSMDVSVVDN